MSEARLREDIALLSRSLFERGFSVGSAGNISVAVEDSLAVTPTNSCLGFLDPGGISKIDRHGRHVSGDPPSKEIFLHRAFYETRPGTGAVVRLHSTFATAMSCLPETDPNDCIPPITPYVVMRHAYVVMRVAKCIWSLTSVRDTRRPAISSVRLRAACGRSPCQPWPSSPARI
ncbi:class II aldolase/adducin family protein [Bradyrhizobium sp. STM 3557]|uniref:class II aldolase/adducin family protein n=1 Tax=Bradyrhizobium sp. STM 3557 TaxID=578920 RepID=UPI00388E39EC